MHGRVRAAVAAAAYYTHRRCILALIAIIENYIRDRARRYRRFRSDEKITRDPRDPSSSTSEKRVETASGKREAANNRVVVAVVVNERLSSSSLGGGCRKETDPRKRIGDFHARGNRLKTARAT